MLSQGEIVNGRDGFGNSAGSSALVFEPEKPEGLLKLARAMGGLKRSSGAQGRWVGRRLCVIRVWDTVG